MALVYPQPIPDNAIDLTPVATGFADDLNGTLGDSGTPTDGFDELLALLTAYSDESPAVLAGLDAELGTLDATAPGLGEYIEGDAVNTYTQIVSTGQPFIDKFNGQSAPGNARVWPGSMMVALATVDAARTENNKGGGTVIIDSWIYGGTLFGKLEGIHAGLDPFPVKIGIDMRLEKTVLEWVSIDLDRDVPAIERVWNDAFTSVYPNEVWNIYLDINPNLPGVVGGEFPFNIRLYDASGGISFISCKIIIKFGPPQGAPPPTSGGAGGTGGAGGGGAGPPVTRTPITF